MFSSGPRWPRRRRGPNSTPSTSPRCPPGTSTGYGGGARVPSASSTATSTACPAVWHKEIMWMMEHGVHVFGAAGLGALRAAELDSFGMHGAGWVYQAFRDGTLDRDDEVAVRHGTAEDGYRPLSEAMVNIRPHAPGGRGAGNRLRRHARHPPGRRNGALLPGPDLAGVAHVRRGHAGRPRPSLRRCGGGFLPGGSTSRPPTPWPCCARCAPSSPPTRRRRR